MSALDQFNKVVTDFDKNADFITIYIKEAHPLDGWYIPGEKYDIHQHKTIDDRIVAAKQLEDYGVSCPILLDTMDDEGVYQYAAHPEALYIIENGVVQLKGLGPFSDYNPEHVREWLENYVKRN